MATVVNMKVPSMSFKFISVLNQLLLPVGVLAAMMDVLIRSVTGSKMVMKNSSFMWANSSTKMRLAVNPRVLCHRQARI